MIYLTEKAANKIKEISIAEGIGHNIIRVKVKGGGCAGMENDLYFDDQISDTDEIFELDDVKLITDFLSFQYLDETIIDYVEGPISSGFRFNNPNVKGSCG